MSAAPILSLAWRSILSRGLTAALTVAIVAVSVMLYLGVEKARQGARASFENTISGVDLIVGARSSPVNLLLYSVFHIGDATNNITWDSYQQVAGASGVAWTVPISLGDSIAVSGWWARRLISSSAINMPGAGPCALPTAKPSRACLTRWPARALRASWAITWATRLWSPMARGR